MNTIIARKILYIFIASFTVFFCCAFIKTNQPSEYCGLSVSPNGKWLAVTTTDKLQVFRYSTKELIFSTSTADKVFSAYSPGPCFYVTWSPDSNFLAIGLVNGGVEIWETSSWHEVSQKIDKNNEYYVSVGIAWSKDSSKLALGNSPNKIRVWDSNTRTWSLISASIEHLISLFWQPDGSLIILDYRTLLNLTNGEKVQSLDHWIDGYGNMIWNADSSHVLEFFDIGGSVMDVKKNVHEFRAGTYPTFAWSKDGRLFATVQQCDGEIWIWDSIANLVIRRSQQRTDFYALAWTPNNELLALVNRENSILIWNVTSGIEYLRFENQVEPYCVFH